MLLFSSRGCWGLLRVVYGVTVCLQGLPPRVQCRNLSTRGFLFSLGICAAVVIRLPFMYFINPKIHFHHFDLKRQLSFKEILKVFYIYLFWILAFPILVRNCEARDQSLSCIDFISLCTLCHV